MSNRNNGSKAISKPKNKNNKQNHKELLFRSVGTGIPPRIMVSLKYCDVLSISSGTAYGQYTFRGNSLFDPDYTATGHQPRYFDQYGALYSKYKVISSSIRVSLSNYSTSSSCIMTVTPHSEILTLTSYPVAAEQPLTKRTEQVPVSTRMGAKNTVIHFATSAGILGLSPAQLASEDYSALIGANPLSVWYWNIGFFNPQGANVSATVDVDMVYDALFYDRLDPGQS